MPKVLEKIFPASPVSSRHSYWMCLLWRVKKGVGGCHREFSLLRSFSTSKIPHFAPKMVHNRSHATPIRTQFHHSRGLGIYKQGHWEFDAGGWSKGLIQSIVNKFRDRKLATFLLILCVEDGKLHYLSTYMMMLHEIHFVIFWRQNRSYLTLKMMLKDWIQGGIHPHLFCATCEWLIWLGCMQLTSDANKSF